MYSECIPFTAIPHTSQLLRDFLYHFDRVQAFYGDAPPQSAEWVHQHVKVPYDPPRRAAVADVLERQNRQFGASEKTLANIERFRRGALAVVTGQQTILFGGPALCLYKALTAIKVAQEFTRAGVECVPIFWMATEDHDLAEVNQCTLTAPSEVRLAAEVEGHGGAPVGELRFTSQISEAVTRAAEELGENEIVEALRDSYLPEQTFGSAFARLLLQLFSRYGLVMCDPLDLHALVSPVYSAVVERSAELNRLVQQRGKDLELAGYHQQVKVTGSTSFLFAIQDGARTPVHRNGNGFTIGDAKISKAELLERIRQQPRDISANALLRTSVQDFLFPTIVYIGGPSEVAYFAQSSVLQRELLGRATPIMHRFSATLVDQHSRKLLERYRLALPDFFHGPERVRELLAARNLPKGIETAFTEAQRDLESNLTAIRAELQKLDPTLVDAVARSGSKMKYQLQRLQARAARAELRRRQDLARHAEQLNATLYPDKALQERSLPGIQLLAQHGKELLDALSDSMRMECRDHQVVFL